MTIAQRERRERQLYQQVAPQLLEGVLSGREQVALADELLEEIADQAEAELELDARTVYRWIRLAEDEIDRRRRMAAILWVMLLWPGILLMLLAPLGSLIGWFSLRPAELWSTVAGAAVLTALSISRLAGLRRRVAQRWLDDQLDTDEDEDETEQA